MSSERKVKLNRRAFLRAGLMAAGGAAVAACSPSTPAPAAPAPAAPAQAAPTSAPAAQAPAAPTAAPAAQAKETVTIVYYSWGDEQKWASENRCFDPFYQAHPEIKVDFQGMTWAAEFQKLLAQVAAGDPPDIWRMESWKSHAYYSRGICLALDDLFKRDGIDPAKTWGPAEANTQCVYQGKWYGTPRGATGCDVMFYNRAILDKHGITWPEKTPDWTWDDVLNICKEVSENTETDTRNATWGIYLVQAANNWQGAQEFIWNWGAEEFSADYTKCTLDDPAAMEGLQFLADFRNKWHVSPYPAQLPEGMGNPFQVGRCAFDHTGSFQVNVYKIIKDFDWGIAPVPKGPKGALAYTKPNSTVIAAQSKHKEEAWAMLKHINSDENVKCEALEGLWPPNKPEMMKEDWFLHRTTPPYDMSPAVPGLLRDAKAPQFTPWSEKIRSIIQAEFDPVWLGKKTIAEAVPTLVPKVNEVLASTGPAELS